MSMGDGKAKNVLEYLDNLIEKGKATSGAIKPLMIAFSKVMQTIDGETWESTDVKSIDIDDYMARFANLTMGKYSSKSLTEYKSRVNKVIGWYIQFLDKPGWTPDIQKRNRTPKSSSTSSLETGQISVIPRKTDDSQDTPQTMPSVINAPGRILYPYPLLDGQLIHISLPVKLSKQDARRIGIFIESIAIESNEEAD